MPEPPHPANAEYDPSDEYRPEPEPEPVPPAWMDGSLRIGIHASIAGSYLNALEAARKLGCNALQMFSASPRMWTRAATSRIAEVDARRFQERRAELGLGPLVVHDNYLINLASTQPMLKVRSVQTFHDELVRAVTLGADFLVAHPGARGEASVEQAVEAVAQGIRQAVRGLQLGGLRILIENTAGMGTSIGWHWEEIAAMLERVDDLPVGVCLDTAHAFAAGYDIRSAEGLETTIQQIERTIGLDRVCVVHTNDSKTPLGSRVDRHEHIGKGKIGLEAFRRILRHPRLAAVGTQGAPGRAFILETPIDRSGDDRRNVRTLWELAGRADTAPQAEKGFSMLGAARKKQRKPQRAQSRKARAGKKRNREKPAKRKG
jgi:deoxyribonuclease IV